MCGVFVESKTWEGGWWGGIAVLYGARLVRGAVKEFPWYEAHVTSCVSGQFAKCLIGSTGLCRLFPGSVHRSTAFRKE